ncbi:protoheme IX farnesyltransferase [Verrucomicrobiaceae bacterium N1E253]|uniref:Protoheme IX farnesyltransferase n=1 Tax=Oceaniferula marina TaxID=2748318 RepID=A0A851GC78_9BACT|nr:heme o synthase [Oceaniferula marina]NWK55338.1 protoheme IX farnesyltransferase [Oceaniferula marina]
MARKRTSNKAPTLRSDLAVLTKLNLNTFVLITTLFGYLLGSRWFYGVWLHDGWLLAHTLIGTGCTAFGSAAFNQLMEIEEDARMERTADRPLPSRRMIPVNAFGIGWGLSAFGIIHLAIKVNAAAAYLAAIALGVYVFIYTPLKRRSSINTLIGAIPGAIPPMIGWAAIAPSHPIHPGSWMDGQSWYLFAFLFLWQMPHFVAISWLCREEYEDAGYAMWSNGDASGKKTAIIATGFTLLLIGLAPLAQALGYANVIWSFGGAAAGLVMLWLCWVFKSDADKPSARKLFFYTLLYLPLSLGLLAIGWNVR